MKALMAVPKKELDEKIGNTRHRKAEVGEDKKGVAQHKMRKSSPLEVRLRLGTKLERLLARIAKATPSDLAEAINVDLSREFHDIDGRIEAVRQEMKSGARPGKRKFHL